MAAPNRQLWTMAELIDAPGISEDSIRREMKKGLPSRFQAGRRRFIRCDAEAWFGLGNSAPTAPVKSFAAIRITEDADSLPPAFTRPPSRKAEAA